METSKVMRKTLDADKKNRIIAQFLQDKFKATYNPIWLNTPQNYQNLAKALDFFHNVDEENLSLTAVGSENDITRADHKKHYEMLATLLDKFVVFSDETPPVATEFNEKDATLMSIELKQGFEARSLRDLHAQRSNLGVAEKFLNQRLSANEWLSDLDLGRALTKLGARNKVHITRLNAADIGMILHFEREKHGASLAPYSIPLLINCGSSGSLTSQGSHWTEAMIRVNPATNTITIDYADSMSIEQDVAAILRDAVHYNERSVVRDVEKLYSAFPGVVGDSLTINIHSDNSQADSWSCGYRALHRLLSHPHFPVAGIDTASPPWSTFINTPYVSSPLRDAVFQLLIDNLQINQDFFEASKHKEDAFTSTDRTYTLSPEYVKQYIAFLANTASSTSKINSANFAKEYELIAKEFAKFNVKTDRAVELGRLQENVNKVLKGPLSADAKIFALVDVLATEYDAILKTTGGSNSKLAKAISKFADEQLGVTLAKGPSYNFKKGGLLLQVITKLGTTAEESAEESVLPKPKTPELDTPKISRSTPTISSPKVVEPKVSPSVGSISPKTDPTQVKLLPTQDLSRVGTMFGTTQFCYGGKPSGVEPGFRAIDLDDAFFEQLQKIVPPSTMTGKEVEAYTNLLETLRKAVPEETPVQALDRKQKAFAFFINALEPAPHAPKALNPTIGWLCEEIKEGIKSNQGLSAWLYKLDYAQSGAAKKRTEANKEALREFSGTRLAGIFSHQNQRQEIVWVGGPSGPHAMLACGWKNGLVELTQFLHGGGSPDYNGVLVDDPKADIKRAKRVPGLGENLIFGLAIGDRDGIGKDAQNKGFASDAFYGFDYGKPYEGDGVCSTLRDDFSFTNPWASTPEFMRGTSTIGVGRHKMYRNYSIFYDTPYSDRLMGVHLLKKMITGENPSEAIMASYPEQFRHELFRIQQRTPTPETLLPSLREARSLCREGSPIQGLLDNLSVQISTGKLQTFNLYFAEIKIDLIAQALKTGMPEKELEEHLKSIDSWAATAAISNQQILDTFQHRLNLTCQEVDFLDKMEKVFSPTSCMSHDGSVFLNFLRIRSPDERIPFQLTKLTDGSYVLTTPVKGIRQELKDQLGLPFRATGSGLSCHLSEWQLSELMNDINQRYDTKQKLSAADAMLKLHTFPKAQASFKSETVPQLRELLAHENTSLSGQFKGGWDSNNVLSLDLIAKTAEQVKLIQQIFKLPTPPRINETCTVSIPPRRLEKLQHSINEAYQRKQGVLTEPASDKWAKFYKAVDRTEVDEEVRQAQALIARFARYHLDPHLFETLKTAIGDLSFSDVGKLLSSNDNTLQDETNIQHIINDEVSKLKPRVQEIELEDFKVSASAKDSDHGLSL
ncbi:hypothetical protein [Legionella cardiaca]|uniref:Uncharacterized protein n=1 Tax=Legionella cardiaca TaxID=1071983 RepID=A0ABY8ARA2_9GAMM|nr:hypothetical protein [Legionella cardiaca]WED43185.1 hypothetical protein PXX05_15030 [Legionella cardiaca]